MKTFVATVAAASLFAGAALAGDIRGKVETIDADNNMIELNNGVELIINDAEELASLNEGDRVKVYYKNVRGQFVAKRVKVTSPAN